MIEILFRKMLSAMFLVLIMVNITPAFAIEMEQVANEAQNYNEQSHQNMGFFKKIGFMVKGFKLVNKANDAQENSKTPNTEEQMDINHDVFNHTILKEWQKQKLLNFRNNENNILKIHTIDKIKSNINNKLNSTKNKLNQTNIDKPSATHNQTEQSSFVIPDECYTDIQNLKNILELQNMNLKQQRQSEIGDSLQGTIVQLIDETGNIRYAYVKNVDLKTGQINLLTNESKELTMGLNEFKKDFKGLTLTGFDLSPEEMMGKISQTQKDDLNFEQSQADKAKDDSINKMILWGVLLGVGCCFDGDRYYYYHILWKAIGCRS
jgi:hypothetical protein